MPLSQNPSLGHKIVALWAPSLKQMVRDKPELTKSILMLYKKWCNLNITKTKLGLGMLKSNSDIFSTCSEKETK